jgi:hypothetical protein
MWQRSRLVLTALVAAALFLGFGQASHAQPTAPQQKAKAFLDNYDRANFVLVMAQFGAKLQSYQITGPFAVNNQFGMPIPGEFGYRVEYRWERNGNGTSTIAFMFDQFGNLKNLYADQTPIPSIIPEFGFSNLAVGIAKAAIERDLHNVQDPQLKQFLQQVLQSTDSRTLTLGVLKLGQALGK